MYRRHPLAETLAELTRESLFQRVLLRGLGQTDVERFIEVATGVAPPQELTQAVYTQTEGNPLFVTEVVRLLVQEGGLAADQTKKRDSWTVRIPEGVREVIGRRLNRLSQRCNDTLIVASVIGREFTLDQMKPLVEDMSEDRLLEVLEEALVARLIEEQAVGRYQFTHALIQDTLTEELTLTLRVRLHATIAESLERLYGGDAEAHAAELAHHFAEAEAVLGSEKLARYSILAGERALFSYAYEEALSHFQMALAAKEDQEMDAEKAALLFGLGRAQAAIFGQHLEEAASSLGRAFEYYDGIGDAERAVSVAEYPLDPYPGTRTGTAHLLSRALELSPPGSLRAGRLSSRLARVLAIEEGEFENAQKAFDTAIDIARREGDASLEMQTLANAAQSELNQMRFRQSLELTARSIALAPRAKEYRAEALAHHMAGLDLTALGDPVAAQEHASSLLLLAEQLRNRYFISAASGTKAIVSGLVGNWNDARRFGEESLTAAPMDPRTLGLRIMVEFEVGNLGGGEAFLERLLETMRITSQEGSIVNAYVAFVLPAISRLTSVDDRLDVAEQVAHAVVSSRSATPLLIHAAQVGLALLAIQRDDASAAGMRYAALNSIRDSISTLVFTTGDRILGLLAQTMGNLDKAGQHFEGSLLFCRKAGYRPELAWTCCDYADTLIQRNNKGDKAKATTLLDESLSISRDLGMRPLMERAQNRLDLLGSADVRSDSYPSGLTEREVEVLRLVAIGRSNREIADELIISLRTVANHVANILNKTNSANRAEAASFATREGLA